MWEYMVVNLDTDGHNDSHWDEAKRGITLQQYGKDGWECFAVSAPTPHFDYEAMRCNYYLKRRLWAAPVLMWVMAVAVLAMAAWLAWPQ